MPDRTIYIALEVSGHQNGDGTIKHTSDPTSLQYRYELIDSTPAANGPVVASNGDIDLSFLPQAPGYSNRVDIYFDVIGTITGNNGNPYPIRFATALEHSNNPAKQTGFCWRVNNETEENPIPWPANISARQISETQVMIDDQSPGNSSPTYYYCLGTAFDNINQLGAPEQGSYYYVTFDPKIVHG